MLADVADYGEWQSGRNLAGTQMAVNGFSNKVSSACASAIVAGLLAWGAYDGTVAVQSSKANMAILFAFVILPIIANIVSIVVMYFYDLDKQYDQMERELKSGEKTGRTNCRIKDRKSVLKAEKIRRRRVCGSMHIKYRKIKK